MAAYLTWRKGSTFRAYFDVTSGEISGNEPVRCGMKQRRFGEPFGEEIVAFGIEYLPGDEGIFPCFEITGQAEDVEDLKLGDYLADFQITFDDGDFQSDTVRIQLLDRVTEDGP